MRKYFYIFILLTVFSYANDKIVKIATLEDYAPFCIASDKYTVNQTVKPKENAKNFYGYSWDVLRESYHIMGYTIELTISPWPRSMRSLKQGEVDILFPTSISSERKKIFDYSKESINEANFVIYVKSDSDIYWNGLESLAGKVIGVKRGFNYGDKWEQNKSIVKYDVNTILKGFKMLKVNRFDGFIGYEYNWDYILKQQGWKESFKKFPAFDSSSEHLVSLKSNFEGKKLLSVFDMGKRKLRENGRLAEIKREWFGD